MIVLLHEANEYNASKQSYTDNTAKMHTSSIITSMLLGASNMGLQNSGFGCGKSIKSKYV
jgi:hypothetical protein